MGTASEENKIGEKETAFHLSTVIDLKTAIVDYFEGSNLGLSWGNTSEEDQNGICSVLLMDFLIELSLTLQEVQTRAVTTLFSLQSQVCLEEAIGNWNSQ